MSKRNPDQEVETEGLRPGLDQDPDLELEARRQDEQFRDPGLGLGRIAQLLKEGDLEMREI